MTSKKVCLSEHCEKTATEPIQGDVQGTIPKWLEGTLIRNGPGIQKIGPDSYKHVFDGLAILHRYQIQGGTVTYTSHHLESDTYKKNMASNRIAVAEFGTLSFADPCKTLFQRLQATFKLLTGNAETTDNCNVNVTHMGDQLYAITETNFLRRIDPETLKTIGEKTNLTKYVAVNHATAHPHVLSDGSILNMGNNYQHWRGPHYCVVKIPPTFGREETAVTGAKIIAEVPLTCWRKPSYYHSFGMTSDKIIFIESPLRMDLLKFITCGLRNKPPLTAMGWDENVKTRIHVLPFGKTEFTPIIYEADPFFAFHHINAYEEAGQLVVDVVAYTDDSVLTRILSKEEVAHELIDTRSTISTAKRFVLPLHVPEDVPLGRNLVTLKGSRAKAKANCSFGAMTIHVEPEDISNAMIELPRINYRYNGRKYNFFYGISTSQDSWNTVEPDLILKIDVKNKSSKCWTDPTMFSNEPIFVPNPDGTEEDDGVVIAALSHRNEPNRATLVVLEAKNLNEVARVNFHIPGALTTSFHGLWRGKGDKVHMY